MSENASAPGGDITRYVETMKEPLTAGNYSDIDAAVFAQLSYVRFEDTYGAGNVDVNMSLAEYAHEMLKIEENEEQRALLNAIANSERYANCRVTDCASEAETSQWAALTIQVNDGNSEASIVAMRGTDATTLGWQEDFELFYDVDGTEAQRLSKEYLNNTVGEPLLLAGHSKGGNDVISAYLMCDSSVRDRVARITNIDGPGVNPEFLEAYQEGYAELNDKLYSIYPSESYVGMLLIDKPGHITYVDSTDTGFGAHSILNLRIASDNSGYIEEEQKPMSKVINHALDIVMENLSNEERQRVVDVLSLIGVPAFLAGKPEDAGYVTVDEKGIKGAIYKVNAFVYNVTLGLMKWGRCSWSEKIAIGKTLVLLGIGFLDYGAKKYIEAREEIRRMFEENFNAFVAYIGTKANKLFDMVKSFGKEVMDGFTTAYNSVVSFLEENIGWKNVISAAASNGYYRSTYFSANVSSMKAAAVSIHGFESKLQQYCSQVQGAIGSAGSFSNKIRLTAAVTKLNDVKRDCNRYSSALEDIVQMYENAENKLLLN